MLTSLTTSTLGVSFLSTKFEQNDGFGRSPTFSRLFEGKMFNEH
jgi:hypothetical protein